MENLNPTDREESQVIQPDRVVPRKYLPAILFLADRMASSDKDVVVKERSVIEDLADSANLKNFRHAKDFIGLSEDSACKTLDIQLAKRAALVVMALVLKSDNQRKAEEHDYFRRIRQKLGTDAITVPVDLAEHRALALKYLVK